MTSQVNLEGGERVIDPLARTVPTPSEQDLAQQIMDRTLFEWVPIDKMFVAPYGRPLNVGKVAKYRREWDPRKIGVIYLSLRNDGRYAVLDGHHRASAARAQGLTLMPARVYIDLAYEEEAALYQGFATNTTQTRIDLFRAKLEQGDPAALDIRRVVGGQGVKLAIADGNWHRNKIGVIGAVAALEDVYFNHGGREMLQEVLRVLDLSFRGHPGAFSAQCLQGMAMFLQRYQTTMRESRLISVLQREGVDNLTARAKSIHKMGLNTTASAFGKAVLITYNHALKGNLLPEWIERLEQVELSADAYAARGRRGSKTRQERRTGTHHQPLPYAASGERTI